jgi:predicted nucleic acid-binding protein
MGQPVSYLVDTSVLTRLSKPSVAARLEEVEGGNLAIARCLMTDLEVGSSASNGHQWSVLQGMLEAYISVDVATSDFVDALQLQRALAEAGLKGRKPPDLLISALAIRLDLTVLHYDRDFEHVATVSALEHEWIVPAGSVG